MTRRAMYLDYFNNFLSVAAFAEHYGMTESEASALINEQREHSANGVLNPYCDIAFAALDIADAAKPENKVYILRWLCSVGNTIIDYAFVRGTSLLTALVK